MNTIHKSAMAHKPLKPREINRFITTIDRNTGDSIFSEQQGFQPPTTELPGGILSRFCFGTNKFPVDFSNDTDLYSYERLIENPPGLIIPNGTVARLIDFPPGCTSSMHRTLSLNYNFVIQGEIELILDSGEAKVLKAGDMLVQRAVNHKVREPPSQH